MQPYFDFKKFRVWHDKSSLKVCTDACVLGAWANPENAVKILDIGTGSGLLALMLAQKTVPNAQIDAIEIHAASTEQAKQNFELYPEKRNFTLYPFSVQEWAKQPTEKYDYIIVNPPFFENSLVRKNPDRNTAMHISDLTINDLAHCINQLLAPLGRLALMYPIPQMQQAESILATFSIFTTKKLLLWDKENGKPIRVIIEASRKEQETAYQSENIYIRTINNEYTESFKQLLKAYYTIF